MKYFENKGNFQEGLNDPCFEIESEYGSFHFIFKEIKLMESFGNDLQRHTKMRVIHLVILVLIEILLGKHLKILRSEVTLVKTILEE